MGLKSITIAVLLLFFVPVFVSAQTAATDTLQSAQSVGKAKVGTYQIVITETKNVPVFTDELLYSIEQKRDENEIVYMDLGTGVRVTILPRKTIDAPGFVPLEEVVFQ